MLCSNTKKLKAKVADDAAAPKKSPKQGNYLLPGAAAGADPTRTTAHARHPAHSRGIQITIYFRTRE